MPIISTGAYRANTPRSGSGGSGVSQSNPDQWYLDIIKQYESDPDLYQYLLTNPHLYSNSGGYTPYWYESLFGVADTNMERYGNQLRSNANEWLGRALSEHHVEDYTSEPEQLARRKQIGLNDDLNGGSGISAGEAANPGKTQIDEQLPQVDSGLSPVFSVAKAGVSLLQTAFSVYSGLQSVRSAFLDNETKELLLSNNLQDSAWNILGDTISEYMKNSPTDLSEITDVTDPSFVPITDSVITSFAERVNKLPFTNRQKKKIMSFIDELPYTKDSKGNKVYTARYQSLWNNKLVDLRQSRNNLAKASGLPGADVEDQDAIKFIGENVYKPLNDLQIDLAKLEARFNSSYYREAINLDVPSLQAGSEAVQLQFAKDMNDMKLKVTTAFEEINNKITGNKKISENWKMALQVGTSVAESLILTNMNNLPHINIGLRNGVHDTKDVFVH